MQYCSSCVGSPPGEAQFQRTPAPSLRTGCIRDTLIGQSEGARRVQRVRFRRQEFCENHFQTISKLQRRHSLDQPLWTYEMWRMQATTTVTLSVRASDAAFASCTITSSISSSLSRSSCNSACACRVQWCSMLVTIIRVNREYHFRVGHMARASD